MVFMLNILNRYNYVTIVKIILSNYNYLLLIIIKDKENSLSTNTFLSTTTTVKIQNAWKTRQTNNYFNFILIIFNVWW